MAKNPGIIDVYIEAGTSAGTSGAALEETQGVPPQLHCNGGEEDDEPIPYRLTSLGELVATALSDARSKHAVRQMGEAYVTHIIRMGMREKPRLAGIGWLMGWVLAQSDMTVREQDRILAEISGILAEISE